MQIWPGHGAGSACGKSLGSMPQSTLGYEKLFNWAFGDMSEKEFVARVLEDQPVPPRYFAVMKRVNRLGVEQPTSPEPPWMGLTELESAIGRRATVIDTRPADKFAAGHVPGTLNIPLGKSFLNWSGALVPEDRDFYIITEAESDDAVKLILGDLCKIGLTRVGGVFRSDVLREWKSRRGGLEQVPQLDPTALNRGRRQEWSSGRRCAEPRRVERRSLAGRDSHSARPAARPHWRARRVRAHRAPLQGRGQIVDRDELSPVAGTSNVSNLAGGFDMGRTGLRSRPKSARNLPVGKNLPHLLMGESLRNLPAGESLRNLPVGESLRHLPVGAGKSRGRTAVL